MTNSADPDQLASSEANWSGSTLFAKTGHAMFSKRRLKQNLFLTYLEVSDTQSRPKHMFGYTCIIMSFFIPHHTIVVGYYFISEDLILKERRLRWYGHVECSSGAVKTVCDIQVDGKRGPQRPRMTGKQLTERDCREWKLSAESGSSRLSTLMIGTPGDLMWDLPCMQQASYLEGGQWCGCCLCTCMLIKNLMMMMMLVVHIFFSGW